MAKKILIVCGEASGDLNASLLARRILELEPSTEILAVGSELLRQAGAKIIFDIKDLSVMGLFDVLRKLPKFFALKKFILKAIQRYKPNALIMVDFSGFNLRLAKALNNTIPTIYYICPQVWASRSGRLKSIKRFVKKLIVLFKFEEEFYRRHGIMADWVGHPLLDIVQIKEENEAFLAKYNLYESKPVIALLPGSRIQEIRCILPVMLATALMIKKQLVDAQFIVLKSTQVDWNIYHPITHRYDIDLKVIEGKNYDCLNAATFCLVASGTATLETAILKKPFFIIYKMNLLNYLLYRPQVKVPYIGIVNIMADRCVVPEFIQFRAQPKRISGEVLKILNDKGWQEQMKNDLSQISASLGEKGGSYRAAKMVVDFLKNPSA